MWKYILQYKLEDSCVKVKMFLGHVKTSGSSCYSVEVKGQRSVVGGSPQ